MFCLKIFFALILLFAEKALLGFAFLFLADEKN